jgi:hypothetical protein
VWVNDGAYRSTEIRPVCIVCGELTSKEHCRRCSAPLCENHLPGDGERCSSCEEAYGVFRRDLRRQPLKFQHLLLCYFVAAVAVVLTCHLARRSIGPSDYWTFMSYDYAWGPVVVVVVLGCLAPLVVVCFRRLRLRRQFLAERPQQRLISVPPPAPERRTTDEDASSICAFVLSCVFIFPFLPLAGSVLGTVLVTLRHRRFRRPRRSSAPYWLAVSSIPNGLLMFAGQVGLVAGLVCCFPLYGW